MPSPPARTDSLALFLDFDGTLAPIQDDPETVALPEQGGDQLIELAARLDGALAVISGRALIDLSSRVPEALWRLGGHGMDAAEPGEPAQRSVVLAPEALKRAVDQLLRGAPGAWLEEKGPVLAVHYRSSPQAGPHLLAGLQTVLLDYPEYRLQSGKMVLEVKPSLADKGRALERLMRHPPFAGRTPVMIGDDTTDEAAMSVALAQGGYAIKVGAGESVAPYRLKDPQEVWAWLTQPQI